MAYKNQSHPRQNRRALASCTLTAICLSALALSAIGCAPATQTPTATVADIAPPASNDTDTAARAPLKPTELVELKSDSPMVSVRVLFDAGSAEDPAGQEGLTALAAQLMVEGGAGELSYAEMTERLYPMAANLSVMSGRDTTVFIGRVHRDHLEDFYAMFKDVLLRPRFDAQAFARLKQRAETSVTLGLRGNDDEQLGKEVLQAMLYEGHPYAHPVVGSETGLSRLRLDDLRAQRNRVFCGGRAAVGVSGDYPAGFAKRLKADVEALAWETCEGAVELPTPAAHARRVVIVDKPTASSVAISMGLPLDVTRNHADYPALMLAAAYLGQHRQFAGVLMQKMRGDRGLNYGDYAYAEHFDQEGWSRFPLPNMGRRQQYFSIWVRPVTPTNAVFASRMAVRELEQFVVDGMSEADFERIKGFAMNYYALYLQTEARRLGFALDDAYYGNETAYLDLLREAWAKLTPADVNAAVRRHIDPSKLQIAMIAKDAKGLEHRLTAGEPSPIAYPEGVTPKTSVLEEDAKIVSYPLGVQADAITIVPVDHIFRGE